MAISINNGAKVGIMTIVLAGAAYGGYRFVSRDAAGGDGYRVFAYLPDATGVAPKSRVMISGIQVGIVDRIWLDAGRARVDIKMNPDVPLFIDASVGRRAASLIGEYYVVLSPGTEGQPQIPDKGQITHIIQEPSIDALQAQVSDILKDVKSVTESLRGSVGTNTGQQQLSDIMKNLAEVTEQLNETVKENRLAVKDTITNINNITTQSQPNLNAILSNIRQATDDVRKMTAEGKGPDGKGGEIRNAAARIDSALQHADNVAARLDRGEGTLGRLTKDTTLINEVESAVEDVGELVGGVGRLQTLVGLRTDYNFLANTIKSYVELRLQPSEDKYYSIELVNDPRGLTTFEQIDVDTTNPNDPPHYREVRTVTTNAFRFSFQFAKRIGPFTGRFGIKESTGGIGLDLHLLDERFELKQDLFGFGEQVSPRWRVALAYEFIRKLWLLGGVDDILNSDRRDYFIGLQLRFNDKDLKTILPFVPAGL